MKRFALLLVLVFLSNPALRAAKPEVEYDSEKSTHELMRFSGNIHMFNTIFPQEKVFLEFDNTAYFQGETIWFKAFVRHASTLKQAPSKVLYVDFIGPNGLVISQQKLKVIGGQADGAIPLLDAATAQARQYRGVTNYPSGFYEIRAYTQNMLDFNRDAIFTRVIPVYTKPKHEGEYEKSQVVPLKDQIQTIMGVRQDAQGEDRNINLAFYPEGGDLIEGLPCNVAFKATDKNGLPIGGYVISDSDTIPAFHDGMGSFTIIPGGSRTVRFVTDEGKSRRFSLPGSVKSGYSMIASATSDTLYTVSLRHTADLSRQHIGMAVTCRGDLVDFLEINDCPADTVLNIDCSGWPLGVCRMTFYNDRGRILASRSLFHNNSNFRSPTITLFTDSLSRVPFSKEVLSLQLTDKDGNPIRNRFCLSVRDADDYGTGLSDNLMTNLLLSSDLKGYIHDPAWYLEQNDDEHRTALNLLTLVQGWERYEWKTMTGLEYFSEKHRIEDSLTMNGWVLSYAKREPVSDISVVASVMPDDRKRFESFEYVTDTTGYFGFDLSDFYGKAKMDINLLAKKRNGKMKYQTKTRIRFERSDKPESKPYLMEEIDLTRNKRRAVEKKTEDTDDGLPLVIREDLGIVLDDVDIEEERRFVDYDTFTSLDAEKDTEMEMDMGEYSTDVRGYMLEKGVILEDSAVIQLHFYVHNQQKLLTLKPFDHPTSIDMMDVKSILIYDDPVKFGDLTELAPLEVKYHRDRGDMEWLMDLWTNPDRRIYLIDIQIKNDSELSSYRDIRNLSHRTTTIDGFSVPVQYYAPQYPEGPVPGDIDVRRTVYWNPNVITDNEGRARVEFYNNSYSQHYTISGTGITASGIPYILREDW